MRETESEGESVYLLQEMQCRLPLPPLLAGTDGCIVANQIRLHAAASHLLQEAQDRLPPLPLFAKELTTLTKPLS